MSIPGWEQFKSACVSRGVNPVQAAAFIALVIVAIATVALALRAPVEPQFKVVALNEAGQPAAEGALVTLKYLNGTVLATGTIENGQALFPARGMPLQVLVDLSTAAGVESTTASVSKGSAVFNLAGAAAGSLTGGASGGAYAGTMTFIVIDKASGKPVAGAAVSFLVNGVMSKATTSASGQATTKAAAGATVRFRVQATGYREYSATLIASSPSFTVKLTSTAPATTVSFLDRNDLSTNTVSTAAADPVVEEMSDEITAPTASTNSISTESTGTGGAGQVVALTVTDGNGNPVSSGTLSIVDPNTGQTTQVPITNGQGTTTTLPTGGTVSVTQQPSGTPLTGGTVTITPGNGGTAGSSGSGTGGSTTIPIEGGSGTIPNTGPGVGTGGSGSGGSGAGTGGSVPGASGNQPQITLAVTDGNGDLVESGTINVIDPNTGQTMQQIPISGGTATVTSFNPGSTITVTELPSGNQLTSGTLTVTYGGQTQATIPITSGTGQGQPVAIAVSVVDNAGSPLAADVAVRDAAGAVMNTLHAGSDGKATVEGYADGATLMLSATATGYAQSSVSVRVGSARSVTLALNPSGLDTTINTYTETQSPLPASIRIYKDGTNLLAAAVESQGTAKVKLAPGKYTATVLAPGRKTVTTAAFDAGVTLDVPLAKEDSTVGVDYCVTNPTARSCQPEVLPETYALDVTVSFDDGTAAAGAVVTATDSATSRPAASRSAGNDGTATLRVPSGTYSVTASKASATNTVTGIVIQGYDSTASIVLDSTAPVVLSAYDAATGVSLAASFSTPDGGQCTGAACTLRTKAGTSVRVTASAEGHNDAAFSVTSTYGPARVYSVRLVRTPGSGGTTSPTPPGQPTQASATLAFNGIETPDGTIVSSVRPNHDYVLKFTLTGRANGGELSAFVRVASSSAGIPELSPGSAIAVSKSATWNPTGPECADLRNPNPNADGLYQWTEISFTAPAGENVAQELRIPLRVKGNAAESALQLRIRATASDATGVRRAPADSLLGTGTGTATKAACYADTAPLAIPITNPVGSSCTVNGAVVASGACLDAKPLKCLDGAIENDAETCGCPSNQVKSGNSCTEARCADGTPVDQCSQTQRPLSCRLVSNAPALDYDATAGCTCPNGQEVKGGECVPCTAASTSPSCDITATCSISGVTYSYGCVPGQRPSFCGADGAVADAPQICGCPAGMSYDAGLVACSFHASAKCNDLPADSGAASCDSSNQPKQCTATPSGPAWRNNPAVCGCPYPAVLQGNECVTNPGVSPVPVIPSPSPIIGPSPLPSPSPSAPPRQCENRNACLSRGSSEDYCSNTGIVVAACGLCDPTCSGSGGQCDISGRCVTPSCRVNGVEDVEASSCAAAKPYYCDVSTGIGIVTSRPTECGCPLGKKPSVDGLTCVSCTTDDCSEVAKTCPVPQDGSEIELGMCYPKAEFDSRDGTRYACLNNKRTKSLECGCGEGFKRAADGSGCIPRDDSTHDAATTGDAAVTCPSCTANGGVSYNAYSGELEFVGNVMDYQMQADTVFPADAIPFKITQPGANVAQIELGKVESKTGTNGCYRYDAAKAILVFSARSDSFPSCPIVVRGDAFYNGVTKITGDEAKVTFHLNAALPVTGTINVKVVLQSAGSIKLTPTQLSGPETPQLLFLINQKQAAFGPRVLRGKSSEAQYADGATALAWRGPGSLKLSEDKEEIAAVNYEKLSSYFSCTGQVGLRVESCSDAFCCAGGWCDADYTATAAQRFSEYATSTARATAFRRGNGEPYKTLAAYLGNKPFTLYTAAQIVEGAQTSLTTAGFKLEGAPATCKPSNPAVYQLAISTMDGKAFTKSGKTMSLKRYAYLDGTCADGFTQDATQANPDYASKPLCNFLYGDCSCIRDTNEVSLASNTQSKTPKPLKLDSYFMGTPPKFSGPLGSAQTLALDSVSVAGMPLSILLNGNQYYQPIACNGLAVGLAGMPIASTGGANAAYKKLKPATEKNCRLVQIWATYADINTKVEGKALTSTIPMPVVIPRRDYPNTNKILPELNRCEDGLPEPKPISACRAQLDTFSEAEKTTISGQILAQNNLCSSQCESATTSCSSACTPTCQLDCSTKFGLTPVCVAPDSMEPATAAARIASCTSCISSCVPMCEGTCRASGGVCKTTDCGGAKAAADKELASKITLCKNSITAEITAGTVCENLKGKLMDLPSVIPIPRTAWATCYAYSDECSARCQPKKPYLLAIPDGKRMHLIPHFGLDAKCNPVAPTSIFSTFLKTDTNSIYGQMAEYYGLSALESEFKGMNWVQSGYSIFTMVQAIRENQNCPIPPKPPQTARDTQACQPEKAENDKTVPGPKTGGAPGAGSSGASSDAGSMDGSGFGAAGPAPADGSTPNCGIGADGEPIPC